MSKMLYNMGLWLVGRFAPKYSAMEAVRTAFLTVGLPAEQFGPEFNLMKSGKLAEVLIQSAELLDSDHQFETVRDVLELFEKE